jgi:hypothetical protein
MINRDNAHVPSAISFKSEETPSKIPLDVAMVSDVSLAPTVIAKTAVPGDPSVYILSPLFPAATTDVTPASTALFYAILVI